MTTNEKLRGILDEHLDVDGCECGIGFVTGKLDAITAIEELYKDMVSMEELAEKWVRKDALPEYITKEEARKFLVGAGIIDDKGNLTEMYQPLKEDK